MPLSSLVRGSGSTPTRLVLFRRPIEHRCETRTDLEAMVLTIVVEQVAELLGHRRRGGRPALRPGGLSAYDSPGRTSGTSPLLTGTASGSTTAPERFDTEIDPTIVVRAGVTVTSSAAAAG